jgi:hypothetical protein
LMAGMRPNSRGAPLTTASRIMEKPSCMEVCF